MTKEECEELCDHKLKIADRTYQQFLTQFQEYLDCLEDHG